MSYSFKNLFDLEEKVSTGFYGLKSQKQNFEKAIKNLKNNKDNEKFQKSAQNMANILFANESLIKSKIIKDIAKLENKKILEALDKGFVNNAQGANRPHTYKYLNETSVEEFKGRLDKLSKYINQMKKQRIINKDQKDGFLQEWEKISTELSNLEKNLNLNKDSKLQISNNDLIKRYTSLVLQTRLSNYATSVYFLAEKASGYITNTGIDNYARKKIDTEVLKNLHTGDKGSQVQVSTGGSQELEKIFKQRGYNNSEVTGRLVFSETFDKADFIVNGDSNNQMGVSVKTTLTGNPKVSLQGQSALAAYLSQDLFLTTYTNNLIRALFGIGENNEEAFELAKKMIVFTAFVGYSSQNYQASAMLRIDQATKSVSYFPMGEALGRLLESNQGYSVLPASILQFGGLNRDNRPKREEYRNVFKVLDEQRRGWEQNFANAYVSVSISNINKFIPSGYTATSKT